MPRLALLVAAALPLAASAQPRSAEAVLKDASGKQVGTAKLSEGKDGVTVTVVATGLPPGKHGLHLHAVGKCDDADFKSAGTHFNPTGKKHGHQNPEGAHAGDLPNLDVKDDGSGRAEGKIPGASLASLLAKDGTALVVHSSPDDEKTDPAGNSGARIACGVVRGS